MKFRIIELVHDAGSGDRKKQEFIIQQKVFLRGWRELKKSDGVNTKRNSFDTYEKAESYIYEKYCGHGLATKNGNYYLYEPYRYYV
jgi:hypothetical protein